MFIAKQVQQFKGLSVIHTVTWTHRLILMTYSKG